MNPIASPPDQLLHTLSKLSDKDLRSRFLEQYRRSQQTQAVPCSPQPPQHWQDLERLEANALALDEEGRGVAAYRCLGQARTFAREHGLPQPSPLPLLDRLLERLGTPIRAKDQDLARSLVFLALERSLNPLPQPSPVEVQEATRRESSPPQGPTPDPDRGVETRFVDIHCCQLDLARLLWPAYAPETARKRLQRALARLASAGLVRWAARVGNALDRESGQPTGWYDGTLFRVALVPSPLPSITPADLSAPWRDLEGDIEAGNTARRRVSQPLTPRSIEITLQLLKNLPFRNTLKTTFFDWDTSPRLPSSEQLRVALDSAQQALVREVGIVAHAAWVLSGVMRDRKNQGFYHCLLEKVRAEEGVEGNAWAFRVLQRLGARVLEGIKEGTVRRPGAYLISLLRLEGLDHWTRKSPGPMLGPSSAAG